MSTVTAVKSERRAGKVGISAREATGRALEFFRDLFPYAKNLGLEEIEISEDAKSWLVTVGYDEPPPKSPVSVVPEFLQIPIRKLKTIKVNAKTGAVSSMKIHILD